MPKALALTIEAFVVVFALLVAYGCALSVGYAIEHGLWVSLALVTGSCLLYIGFRLHGKHASRGHDSSRPARQCRINGRTCWRVFLVLLVLALPLMLLVSQVLLGRIGEDYNHLFSTASAYVHDTDIPYLDRYGAYPNNHFLLVFMIHFFDLIQTLMPNASDELLMGFHTTLNVLLILCAIFLVSYTCRMVWGYARGALCGFMLLAYAPIWANCANPYTDTAAMFFVAIAAFFAGKLYMRCADTACPETAKERGDDGRHRFAPIVFSLAFGATCGVGFELKATVAILLVAFIIVAFLCIRPSTALKLALSMIVSFALSVSLCSLFVDRATPTELAYGETERYEQQFPYIHWIMMGMNPESGGKYTENDYLYTSSYGDIDSKGQADKELLIERIDELGGAPGVIAHIAFSKATNQWAVGALLEKTTFINNSVMEGTEGWDTQTKVLMTVFGAYSNYAQAYHILLLLMICLGCLRFAFNLQRPSRKARDAIRRKDASAFQKVGNARLPAAQLLALWCIVAIFGLGIFLCVLWEVKARYLLHFIPLLAILGTTGIVALRDTRSFSG